MNPTKVKELSKGEVIVDKIENRFDAELFADALNTIQKCRLMPSELLKQRDELLNFIIEISETSHLPNQVKYSKELIKKIKQ